jgi:hypothetical protein
MEVWEHGQVNTLLYQENEFGWVNVQALHAKSWLFQVKNALQTQFVHTLYMSKIRKIKPGVSLLRSFWTVRDGSCVRRCGTASLWEKPKGALPEHPSALGNQ